MTNVIAKAHSQMSIGDQVFSWRDNCGLGEIITLGYRPRIKFTSPAGYSNEGAILRSDLIWNKITKRWETNDFPSDLTVRKFSEWQLKGDYKSLHDQYVKSNCNLTDVGHNGSYFIIQLAMYYGGIVNAFIDCVYLPRSDDFLQFDIRFYSLSDRLSKSFVSGLSKFTKVILDVVIDNHGNYTIIDFKLYKNLNTNFYKYCKPLNTKMDLEFVMHINKDDNLYNFQSINRLKKQNFR